MPSKSPITCHILDASLGKPAAGVDVRVQEHRDIGDGMFLFEPFASGTTDADGRCMNLLPTQAAGSEPDTVAEMKVKANTLYKVVFKTKEYFEKGGRKSFYPWVEITFELGSLDEHYHIPLLISPYSFTTYRGS